MRISDWSSDVCSSDLGEMRRNKRCSCRCRSAPRKSRAWAGQNGSTLFRSDGELLFLAPLTRHIGFENRKKVAAERLAVDVDHADAVRLARRLERLDVLGCPPVGELAGLVVFRA